MGDIKVIKCVVVDDEPLAVKLIADYVVRTPGIECTLATSDVIAALQLVQSGTIDVVFLDIQMPELTGIQFMKIIRNNCGIIVTSAYAQYAIEGYEYDIIDYLLKPVTFERFSIAVEKARLRLHQKSQPGQSDTDHIFIKTNNRLQRIDHADILFIEGLRDYIAIHTKTGKYLSLESMKNILASLPADQFVRIHKSYIVNKTGISFVEKGSVVLQNQRLPIGDTYREEFLRQINKLG